MDAPNIQPRLQAGCPEGQSQTESQPKISGFWSNYRPPGSYPKTGVMSGLATILPGLEPQVTVSLEERFGLWLLKESLSTKGKKKWGMENV